MVNPEAYHLDRIMWQFFGSLTFTRAEMPTSERMCMVFALLRKIAKPLRVHFPEVLWVLRLEEGEITARRHFHLLIAGLPEWHVKRASCFALMRTWEGLGGGIARCRIYDPRLAGVAYITKCLTSPGVERTGEQLDRTLHRDRSLDGANRYELGKFSSELVQQLTLSRSVQDRLRCYVQGSGSRRGDMSRSAKRDGSS